MFKEVAVVVVVVSGRMIGDDVSMEGEGIVVVPTYLLHHPSNCLLPSRLVQRSIVGGKVVECSNYDKSTRSG